MELLAGASGWSFEMVCSAAEAQYRSVEWISAYLPVNVCMRMRICMCVSVCLYLYIVRTSTIAATTTTSTTAAAGHGHGHDHDHDCRAVVLPEPARWRVSVPRPPAVKGIDAVIGTAHHHIPHILFAIFTLHIRRLYKRLSE